MKKIAILQDLDLTNKLFNEKTMASLKKFGQVVINKEKEKVTIGGIKETIKDADVAITSWGCKSLTKEILDEAANLKLVLHAAGTVKGIVTPELWKRGIRVSSSAEAIGTGVAETALGLTIVSLKNIWNLSQDTKEGKWESQSPAIKELNDISIGVISAGRVGRHYIKLLQNFNLDILLYDPFITEQDAEEIGAQKVSFEELLKRVDLVSIHAPSIPETNKMFNKDTLSLMKDNAIIINTARGSVIDEEDLVAELKKGRLFACIDVTDPEPPSIDHPFRTLPNVILTPHIAGVTNNGFYRISRYVISEISLFNKGEKMRGEVLEEMLSTLA